MAEEFTEVKNITKVLIVEDNDFDFELVERKLKKMDLTFELKRASCAQEYEYFLLHYAPDLILSDFSIPSYSGLKALEFAKSVRPEVPFLFVSGSIGEERAVEALKQGADDYVLKDNLNKLEPSVRRALAEAREKEKRKDAEKKLRIKNKELRDLVYRISHDFKGPICTIQGAISLSKVTSSREEYLLYADAVDKVIVKLDGIVKNLSNFQFVFADEVQLKKFNLDSLASEAINTVSLSLVEEVLENEINIQVTGEKEVYNERNFLVSILYNLIHNAVVFSDKQKSVRAINCVIHNNEKGLSLIIKDNGIGISEKVIGRVCEMFYRGNVSSQGAGLGLYIVKSCTELLNGKLKIKSSEGVGTEISIFLPHPEIINPKLS